MPNLGKQKQQFITTKTATLRDDGQTKSFSASVTENFSTGSSLKVVD